MMSGPGNFSTVGLSLHSLRAGRRAAIGWTWTGPEEGAPAVQPERGAGAAQGPAAKDDETAWPEDTGRAA